MTPEQDRKAAEWKKTHCILYSYLTWHYNYVLGSRDEKNSAALQITSGIYEATSGVCLGQSHQIIHWYKYRTERTPSDSQRKITVRTVEWACMEKIAAKTSTCFTLFALTSRSYPCTLDNAGERDVKLDRHESSRGKPRHGRLSSDHIVRLCKDNASCPRCVFKS